MRPFLIALFCLAQVHGQDIATRSLTLDAHLLTLPVCNGEPKQMMKLELGVKAVREVEIDVAGGKKPDLWVFLVVRP